jgi:protein-S-isoprenylcysteine O-methyltransferase Ste14
LRKSSRIALGIAIWVGAWPMFLAPIAVFATKFGAAYDDYVARVGRWL